MLNMAARQVKPSSSTNKSSNPKDILTNNPSFTILIAILVVAAFYIGSLTQKVNNLEKQQAAPAATAPQGAAAGQPVPGTKVNVDNGHFPILGDKNAKVTVIEFADFQCPFCKQWFNAVEPNLMKDYVNTGKVKFAFRQYAFLGQESTWAAEAAECANDQGKFWDFHNYLYQNQGSENSGTFAKDKLEAIAATLGLDTNKFDNCLDTDQHAKDVADELAAGQKSGVTGTPATFVNGMMVAGAQPYTTFQSLIDQEIKNAK